MAIWTRKALKKFLAKSARMIESEQLLADHLSTHGVTCRLGALAQA